MVLHDITRISQIPYLKKVIFSFRSINEAIRPIVAFGVDLDRKLQTVFRELSPSSPTESH
jgi:hypothetical protein